MTILKSWLVILAGLLVIGAAPVSRSGPDDDIASYSLRLPLTVSGNAPVQRFVVPTQALIGMQNSEMSDVRVFDGNGRTVPIARMPIGASPSQQVNLTPLPILGSSSALDGSGVSLKIDDNGRVRIISVDGKVLNEVRTTNVVGALLDARGQGGDAQRLVLSATVPAGQPVTIIIEASEDLKTWRSLGEGVVYRPPSDNGRSRDETILLRGSLLTNTQLRVTWRSDTPLLAPVVIGAAVLTTQRDAATVNKTVSATLAALTDSHSLEFTVPFATPILSIGVDATGGEGLLPIKILGRNSPEAAWVQIGQGNASAVSSPIALADNRGTMIRIEADSRTSGFAAPPTLRFGVGAPEIAFVTSGTPPFTFAAGHPSARDVFLPLDTIAGASTQTIPEAALRDIAIAPIVLAPATGNTASPRSLVLWAILLAVTALLAGIAWHLWSRRPVVDQQGGL